MEPLAKPRRRSREREGDNVDTQDLLGSETIEMDCVGPESERTLPGRYVFDEALGRFRLEPLSAGED